MVVGARVGVGVGVAVGFGVGVGVGLGVGVGVGFGVGVGVGFGVGVGVGLGPDLNNPVAAYTALSPNMELVLLPLIATILSQVLPFTKVLQSADHEPPETVPVAVTMVPAEMTFLMVAVVLGPVRMFVAHLAVHLLVAASVV